MMRNNRSMPSSTVIPVLPYPDVAQAAEWLCSNFGFTVRLQIGTHRAQLLTADGSGAVVVREQIGLPSPASVTVRVQDVLGLEARLQDKVHVLHPATDYPYGERQLTVEDFNGHVWTFSESIADVDPASWLRP